MCYIEKFFFYYEYNGFEEQLFKNTWHKTILQYSIPIKEYTSNKFHSINCMPYTALVKGHS